jgi:hypothetical protein
LTPPIIKTITIQGRESILIHLDPRSQRIEFDCFVGQAARHSDGRFSPSANWTKAAIAALVIAATASNLQSGLKIPLRIITGSAVVFLSAALGRIVDDVAQDVGEANSDAFMFDVQRQYFRRRCHSSDTVPFVNRTDEPIELCVIFSAVGFMKNTQDLDILYTVLEPDHASLLSDFEMRLSPIMTQLLSKSTAAVRRRQLVVPALLNVCVGAAAYGVLLAIPLLGREVYRVYSCADYKSCMENAPMVEWIEKFAGEKRGKMFFESVQSTRPFFESFSVVVMRITHWMKKLADGTKSTGLLLSSIPSSQAVLASVASADVTSLDTSHSTSAAPSQAVVNAADSSDSSVVKPFRMMMQGWKNSFFARRVSDLWCSIADDDLLQQLNFKKLDESRSKFIQSFLETARSEHFRSPKDVEKFVHLKKQLQEWLLAHNGQNLHRVSHHTVLKSAVAADEEALFKDLDQIWSVWSDEAGQLRFSNALSWIGINFYSAVMSKNEVAACFNFFFFLHLS